MNLEQLIEDLSNELEESVVFEGEILPEDETKKLPEKLIEEDSNEDDEEDDELEEAFSELSKEVGLQESAELAVAGIGMIAASIVSGGIWIRKKINNKASKYLLSELEVILAPHCTVQEIMLLTHLFGNFNGKSAKEAADLIRKNPKLVKAAEHTTTVKWLLNKFQ